MINGNQYVCSMPIKKYQKVERGEKEENACIAG